MLRNEAWPSKATFLSESRAQVPTPGSHPRLFNLDCRAGAPPDDFSVLGPNWGLPTYNWEEMSKDGFALVEIAFPQNG